MDISGASAIVTGGASGIGLACKERLESRGDRVFGIDIRDKAFWAGSLAQIGERIEMYINL